MKPPTLPTLRQLTRTLRSLNTAYSHPIAGPSSVSLCLIDDYDDGPVWDVVDTGQLPWHDLLGQYGCEAVPGDAGELLLVEHPDGRLDVEDESKWDAVAVARRLLAAANDAGYK